MSKQVCCDSWPDGTRWSTDVPDDWCHYCDKTVKNWPEVFEAPKGARLIIWASKHITVGKAAWEAPLPAIVVTEGERKAYRLAEAGAKNAGAPIITKSIVGSLIGFTFATGDETEGGWEGFFMAEPWMIHATFETTRAGGEASLAEALAILGSMKFHETLQEDR